MSKDTNTGSSNSGHWNSGNCNSGHSNSGHWNSGHWNSGDHNSGNCNSGSFNSGSYNSGNCNSGDYNSGYFNTNEPDKIRVFNQWVNITPSEWVEKYHEYIALPLNRWIDNDDMTKEEKKEVDGWETMGGYLKTLGYKEAWQTMYEENPDSIQWILDIPQFDAKLFEEITGIDVEAKDSVEQEALKLLKSKGYRIVKENK